ncbi:Os09g0556750 [Oryza sativa Japonica Group]|uniref:Os09g0556750 protein n=1 Tax=Oryza sativa subsp. japonica TaxID=39947 RepID=A0A0N7KR91_ORYSJ|nr:hypothetical protein EE612_049426 [Oryza sativa]BAT09362.1 Os09g0556750 [Oryza sativa Japonica Group]
MLDLYTTKCFHPFNCFEGLEVTCPLMQDFDPFMRIQALICSWETLHSPNFSSGFLLRLAPNESPFRPLKTLRAHVQSLLLKHSFLGLT